MRTGKSTIFYEKFYAFLLYPSVVSICLPQSWLMPLLPFRNSEKAVASKSSWNCWVLWNRMKSAVRTSSKPCIYRTTRDILGTLTYIDLRNHLGPGFCTKETKAASANSFPSTSWRQMLGFGLPSHLLYSWSVSIGFNSQVFLMAAKKQKNNKTSKYARVSA